MNPIQKNGWTIYLHQLFAQQYLDLRERIVKLTDNLDKEALRIHSDVKLFQSIQNLIYETIPSNPFADYFALRGSLKRYSRVKNKGLPNRYRLFFKVFKQEQKIVILWLGYPRKEGDKKDCYAVFSKMVNRGNFPHSLDELINFSD